MKRVVKIEGVCDNKWYCGALKNCNIGAIRYDEILKEIVIDYDKCVGCGKCVIACPRSALKISEDE